MAQLGAGNGTSWPQRIDTRQVYQNSPLALPDSNTRFDAEVINDILTLAVMLEQILGANPQGNFASLAARLNQFIPGGGGQSNVVQFLADPQWVVPGSVHRLGTPALLLYLYDDGDPAGALDPGAVHVDPNTYDVTIDFGLPQAGLLVLTVGSPSYTTTFTTTSGAPTLTVLGTVHNLGTDTLCWQVWDDAGDVIQPALITVHPTTFDVTLTFSQQPQSGRLVLGVPEGVSSTAITNDTEVQIPGATHGLGTRALCWQVWDDATPAANTFEPESVTVDPDNFDVTFTFGQAQNGRIVLGKAIGASGEDFTVASGGLPNTDAVRVYSTQGRLYLQHGAGDLTVLQSKTGGALVNVTGSGQVGIGTTPTHQLHLSTDDAAKLATATWATTSDGRLKDVLRPYTDGLALLQALEPVWYRYNGLGGIPKDRKEYVGLIAQGVQSVAPYMVTTRRGTLRPGEPEIDLLELQSSALIFAAINAIKTLAAQLDHLTMQVSALTARLAAVEGPP
jgi:hypothetical protein